MDSGLSGVPQKCLKIEDCVNRTHIVMLMLFWSRITLPWNDFFLLIILIDSTNGLHRHPREHRVKILFFSSDNISYYLAMLPPILIWVKDLHICLDRNERKFMPNASKFAIFLEYQNPTSNIFFFIRFVLPYIK